MPNPVTRLTRFESRAATRDRLRTAAASHFARRGIGAVSIDAIAESAGFSRGAFYSNYATKQELLLDLLAEEHKAEIAVWAALIEQAADLAMLLPMLADRFDSFLEGQDLLHVELRLEARRNPAVAAASAASRHEVQAACTSLVEMIAAKAGVSVDAPKVGLLLQAVAAGLSLHIPDPDQPSRGALIVEFLRVVLSAGQSCSAASHREAP